MGRVHKKKIAEYTEAEENKSKEKGGEDAEKNDAGSESENELAEGKKDLNDTAMPVNSAIVDQSDDEDFKSLHGKEMDQDKNSNGSGVAGDAKKLHKRKSTNEKVAVKKMKSAGAFDDSDSDDEPLNGASSASTSKKRKTATTVRKAKVAPKVAIKSGVRESKREKAGPSKKPAESSGEETEEEYEVKEIIDQKIERGITHFLIRWKGYTKDDDTWEPEHTLNCAELIEKFKKKQSAPDNSKASKKAAPTATKKEYVQKNNERDDEDEDEEKEWEVEKIVDFAEEKSGRIFRIRWKGFSAKDDTWEPEENLSCADIIEKFMKGVKTGENMKDLREEPKKTKRFANEGSRMENSSGRKSKRSTTKKRVYYGDSDD